MTMNKPNMTEVRRLYAFGFVFTFVAYTLWNTSREHPEMALAGVGMFVLMFFMSLIVLAVEWWGRHRTNQVAQRRKR